MFLVAVPFSLTFLMLIVYLVRLTGFVYSEEKPMRQARNAGRDQDDNYRKRCLDQFKSKYTSAGVGEVVAINLQSRLLRTPRIETVLANNRLLFRHLCNTVCISLHILLGGLALF